MSVVPRDTLIVAGHTVALTYDDASREYAALRDSCGAVRRDERARWVFAGEKAGETLAGLVTNDVIALTPGTGCYAAALTPKGRIVADVRVFRRETDFLVDVASRASLGFAELVRKYVNPRMAKYADVTESTACVGVYGPRAPSVVTKVFQLEAAAVTSLPNYHHIEVRLGERTLRMLRSPDFGLAGFDIIGALADVEAAFDAIIAGGARPVGLAAADIARVEAGRPEWGIDMDDTTIPQEANLEGLHAISYTKGCYTGQEVVARVHFRGHVNRHLRGLAADVPMPPRGTLMSIEHVDIGEVKSSVISPKFGPIALGMVRREIVPGAEILVRDGEHEHAVRVVELPF
jgi:folate-binding protein YgfZ